MVLGRFGIMIDSMREERRRDVWFAWSLHVAWISCFFSFFQSWRNVVLVYLVGCVGEGVLHIQLLLNHYSKPFHNLSERDASVRCSACSADTGLTFLF